VTAGRKYDVYGLVRSGQAGISKNKFVGKLGHVSEDESGLIYMRARYMDPVLGKFVSEDSAYHGDNWYAYCSSSPTSRLDANGKNDFWAELQQGFSEGMFLIGTGFTFGSIALLYIKNYVAAIQSAATASVAFGWASIGLIDTDALAYLQQAIGTVEWIVILCCKSSEPGLRTLAGVAVGVALAENLLLLGVLMSIGYENAGE
jgi:RHS repeat-associated protein